LVLRGQQIPAVKTNCLRLLRETQQTDLDLQRLASLIRADVSLTHKLLRYANSALFGRREKIDSIVRALMVLGEEGIRRWVALAALPMLATDKPGELVTLSMVRARFCELLAQLGGVDLQNEAFLMGMFSVLDALVDRPLEEALQEMSLGPLITDALLGKAPAHDLLTNIYRLTRSNELGDWDEVERLSQSCRIPSAAIGDAYLQATLWTERAAHGAAA
jgi:EAL and modified HD-GYP domain-containing signal transduction protein